MYLNSDPVLASMVITRDGVWDKRFSSPNGVEWPEGTASNILITDRAGATLATLEAEAQGKDIRYVVDATDLNDVPDGANFEVFVTVPDEDYGDTTYKIHYGRVIRAEASFPANPVNSDIYTGALFTDSVGLRDTLGPFWVQKSGKTVMHDNTAFAKPYGMGNDFILWDSSATHWYSPLKSDSQKVQVSLMKPPLLGGGSVVVVLCSNYTMTNWIGVKFDVSANTVRPVTGNTAGPTQWIDQASTVSNSVATSPDTYTIWYDFPTNTIKLFKGASVSPLLSWTDSTNTTQHGEGHRYTGLIYRGSLLSVGPQVTYWSAKDDV